MTTRAKIRHGSAHDRPPATIWLWIAVEWWFLGLVAYHLVLEHRAHLQGAVPYVLLVVTLLAVYVLTRNVRRRFPTARKNCASAEAHVRQPTKSP